MVLQPHTCEDPFAVRDDPPGVVGHQLDVGVEEALAELRAGPIMTEEKPACGARLEDRDLARRVNRDVDELAAGGGFDAPLLLPVRREERDRTLRPSPCLGQANGRIEERDPAVGGGVHRAREPILNADVEIPGLRGVGRSTVGSRDIGWRRSIGDGVDGRACRRRGRGSARGEQREEREAAE